MVLLYFVSTFNEVTKKQLLLLRMDNTLDCLAESRWLKGNYWQLEVYTGEEEKTLFFLLDWSNSMLSCLGCETPRFLLSLHGERITDVLRKEMFSVSRWCDHVWKNIWRSFAYLKDMFNRFRIANFKLNPKKYYFFRSEMKYFGHIITPYGIHTDPDKWILLLI